MDRSVPFAFPGPWAGGASLIVGPLVWLIGILLRLPFHFFFPAQLEAHQAQPALVDAAYACVGFGLIVTAFGVMSLATRIGRTHPVWATWGGVLAIAGLFARTLHAGADRFAFTLVASQGLAPATNAVGSSYGVANEYAALNPAIVLGWIVLAIGAWRSGVLGPLRALALAAMSALMLGVLKGSSWTSVVAVAGLCVALVPLGVAMIGEAPRPSPQRATFWIAIVVLALAVCWALRDLG